MRKFYGGNMIKYYAEVVKVEDDKTWLCLYLPKVKIVLTANNALRQDIIDRDFNKVGTGLLLGYMCGVAILDGNVSMLKKIMYKLRHIFTKGFIIASKDYLSQTTT